MATVWKTIKPAKIKDKEMRLPLLNAMRRMATKIKADFKATTATWEHKPVFTEKVSLVAPPGPKLTVTTTDEIYGYVNSGTKKHIIRPKKAKALRFQGTYSAKTVPGVIGSTPGGSSGDNVFAMEVHHPGTKARNFDKIIAKKWAPLFRQEMQSVMKEVARASGHAMRK